MAGKLARALVLLTALTLGGVVVGPAGLPARASETPAPREGAAWMTPTTVRTGDRVVLETAGWTPRTQLQAVVCGDDAVGGSTACELTGAVTARADKKGTARHQLTVRKPPRPCPCVVRVATFTAPAMAMNVPFTLVGHKVGTPPQAKPASSDLRVDDVELRGRGGLRALLGLGGTSTMVITLANRGDVPAQAPEVAYGFGRGDVEATRTLDPDLVVPAGGTEQVEVEVDVPLLAFGTHQAVAGWADGTGSLASAGLLVLPLGALLVLLAGLGLVVASDLQRVRERRAAEQPTEQPEEDGELDDDPYPLPDVVYLEDLGAYVVRPAALRSSRLTRRLMGRVRVSDLAALVAGQGDVVARYPDGSPVEERSRAGGGSVTLAQLFARERGTPDP